MLQRIMIKVYTVLVLHLLSITHCFADVDLTKLLSNVELKHQWNATCEKDKCNFISSHESPYPFSENSPVEAVLGVEVFPKETNNTLEEILNSELNAIKNQNLINDYLEEDRPAPNNNIAVFTETINTKKVGFIKYRTSGSPEHPSVMPITVIHGIFLDSNQIVMVHLITFFGGHQEEIREDQHTLLNKLTQTF